VTEVFGQIFGQLIRIAADWVRDENRRLRDRARALTQAETRSMAAWFGTELLNSARVVMLERCPRPAFLTPELTAQLAALDVDQTLLEIDRMAGITFGDLMVIATFGAPGFRLRPNLLFHELVHVAQYRALGVERFMEIYVRGFVRAGYLGTPPEAQAYALTDRFERGEVFSVEAEAVRLARTGEP
jgi:hypothetical protein